MFAVAQAGPKSHGIASDFDPGSLCLPNQHSNRPIDDVNEINDLKLLSKTA
jgi:hypothetical protein